MNAKVIIGLTGKRQVGKTTIARHLVREHGFFSVHPFNGGKIATRAYFVHLGATEEEAFRMTDGDLKETPSLILPKTNGQHATPRYFMEEFGRFLGVQMGYGWTIGAELGRAIENGHERLIVESIAYEGDVLRAYGGKIIKVDGIQREKQVVDARNTDEAVAKIVPDFIVNNIFDSNEELFQSVDLLLEEEFDICRAEPSFEPA